MCLSCCSTDTNPDIVLFFPGGLLLRKKKHFLFAKRNVMMCFPHQQSVFACPQPLCADRLLMGLEEVWHSSTHKLTEKFEPSTLDCHIK